MVQHPVSPASQAECILTAGSEQPAAGAECNWEDGTGCRCRTAAGRSGVLGRVCWPVSACLPVSPQLDAALRTMCAIMCAGAMVWTTASSGSTVSVASAVPQAARHSAAHPAGAVSLLCSTAGPHAWWPCSPLLNHKTAPLPSCLLCRRAGAALRPAGCLLTGGARRLLPQVRQQVCIAVCTALGSCLAAASRAARLLALGPARQ